MRYRGRSVELREGETLLEGLERMGEAPASSCRSGVCQSCMLQSTSGAVPALAQRGLSQGQRARGYFLACVCRPSTDLDVNDEAPLASFSSRVLRQEQLAPGIARVLLEKPDGLEYNAGQFIQVAREDGLTRPYSIASLPSDPYLELHVAIVPDGRMSPWLAAANTPTLSLRGPLGECCYRVETKQRPLLLLGTGTGLAPLIGVVRDALAQGHTGPIRLAHGARDEASLYLWPTLMALAQTHRNLEIIGRIAEGHPTQPNVSQGMLAEDLLNPCPLKDSEIYLCGNPGMVAKLKKLAFLKGASLTQIHTDPFVNAPPPTTADASTASAAP